jgi:hypothetical protein
LMINELKRSCEWAVSWTRILEWNWCPGNRRSIKLVIMEQDRCADR